VNKTDDNASSPEEFASTAAADSCPSQVLPDRPEDGQTEPSSSAACRAQGSKARPVDHPAQWALWRQDDNGHKFLICVRKTRDEAERARKDFEKHHHKQYYFIEPFRQ
jgi:hypothetical protein